MTSRNQDSGAGIGRWLWDRWIRLLLCCYPRRFRDRFGDDLRAQFRHATPPSFTAAIVALRDFSRAGLGARFDDARRAWGERTPSGLDGLRVDTRHILRGMRRRPLFPLAVASTLALAVGLNAVVFAILDTTLLRPLPYANEDRLISLGSRWIGFDHSSVSIPEYLDYRARNRTLESIAAYTSASFNLVTDAGPERLPGARVTASFFDVLSIRPALGRVFSAEQDQPGASNVVVLSDGLWRRRFGADPAIVGTFLTFDSGRREVLGVMPPELRLPDADTELWIPLAINPAAPGPRGNHNRLAIGRLKAGVGIDEARGDFHRLAVELARDHPQNYRAGSGWDTSVRGLREYLFGDFRKPLSLLMAAVLFVLLIAGVNVANLMAARTGERGHEIATRAALGAPRFRIGQQALVEGLLLGLTGGAAGLALGAGILRALRAQLPERLPVPDQMLTDGRVAAVALALAAAAGVLASLSTLRGRHSLSVLVAHRGASGPQRARAVLTVAEIGLATFLLVAGGVALRSFADLMRSDPGVSIDGIATARVTALSRYARLEDLAGHFDRIVTALSRTPGVTHAGLASILPLSGDTSDRGFAIEGRPQTGQPNPDEQMRAVGGDYFQAMGIPLIGGRYFDARDSASADYVAIVSLSAARKHWGTANPIGRRINFGGSTLSEPWTTIVGVVGDIRHRGLDSAFVPVLYIPVSQFPERSLTVVARLEPWRTEGPRVIADAVRTVDPQQPVFAARMMDEWVARSVSEPRFTVLLLIVFASLAMILTAVGIYGVMSSMVARRTRELGVRLALGARPATLLGLVLRRGVFLTLVGLAAGLMAGALSSFAFRAVFVGGGTIDPVVAGLVVALVLGVALLACFVPARRAMRLDPVDALRAE